MKLSTITLYANQKALLLNREIDAEGS